MPKLIMLCGFPGVGKSTFAQKRLADQGRYISRDEIRKGYLQEDYKDYFAHESRVWLDYVEMISESLDDGRDVIADSTNMSAKARRRLLKDIDLRYDGELEILCYYFNVPVEVALARNNQRTGFAHVPEQTLRNMARTFVPPSYDEDDRISIIFEVDENSKIKVI